MEADSYCQGVIWSFAHIQSYSYLFPRRSESLKETREYLIQCTFFFLFLLSCSWAIFHVRRRETQSESSVSGPLPPECSRCVTSDLKCRAEENSSSVLPLCADVKKKRRRSYLTVNRRSCKAHTSKSVKFRWCTFYTFQLAQLYHTIYVLFVLKLNHEREWMCRHWPLKLFERRQIA